MSGIPVIFKAWSAGASGAAWAAPFGGFQPQAEFLPDWAYKGCASLPPLKSPQSAVPSGFFVFTIINPTSIPPQKAIKWLPRAIFHQTPRDLIV